MKPRGKTYLEIGAGEKASTHLMPKIRRGDSYVAIDVRPLSPRNKAQVNIKNVRSSFVLADAFTLPIKENSVDYVLSRNMITDMGFPNCYGKKPRITFRQALEKLEAELHRVTRKGASITFHEDYTPEVLEIETDLSGNTRMQHFMQVFSHRWIIRQGEVSKLPLFYNNQVIKLFKK